MTDASGLIDKAETRDPRLLWAARWLLPPAAIAAITAAGLSAPDLVGVTSLPMLYLAAVVASALMGGRVAAILAAVLAFLAYDLCFIEPRGTLTIQHREELVTLVTLVVVALLTGALAAGRTHALGIARRKAHLAQALLDVSAGLARATGPEAVCETLAAEMARALGGRVLVLLPGAGDDLALAASLPQVKVLVARDRAAAELVARQRQPAGLGTARVGDAGHRFLPVLVNQRLLAVVGLSLPPEHKEGQALLGGMLEQAALALDRAQRARENLAAGLTRETERLQATLLSSLSHDLRTPLAAVVGAASSLRALGDGMDQATRLDLLTLIEEEGERLNRLIGNLFDMTRIEAGRLAVRRDAIDAGEVLGQALARLRRIDSSFRVDLHAEPDLPAASGDAVLLEQVLVNVLDNARKYAGAPEPVDIYLRSEGEWVVIAITDHGGGIPPGELDRIFEKFYRAGGADGRAPGTGLGLPIARGFLKAMGGTIRAESPAQRRGGTRFTIRLARRGGVQ